MANAKSRVVLDLEKRPNLRAVLDRLHEKTGMRNAPDLITMALQQLDANLPPTTTPQPAEAVQ